MEDRLDRALKDLSRDPHNQAKMREVVLACHEYLTISTSRITQCLDQIAQAMTADDRRTLALFLLASARHDPLTKH